MKRILIMLLFACTLCGCQQPKEEPIEPDPLLTKYKIIEEEGFDFDLTPLCDPFYEEGYIVKEKGFYGFIDPLGKYIMYPGYESVLIGFSPDLQDQHNYLWMYPDKKGVYAESLAYYLGYSTELLFSSGIGGVGPVYFLNADNQLMGRFLDGKIKKVDDFKYLDKMRVPKADEIIQTAEQFDAYDFKKWYIANDHKDVWGPFDESFTPCFDVSTWSKDASTFEVVSLVHGMFCIPVKDGYKIYNPLGDACSDEVYEKAEPISWTAVKIEKDGKLGVIDENLDLVLYGEFEDVTRPIQNHAFVKIDGRWVLIEIIE